MANANPNQTQILLRAPALDSMALKVERSAALEARAETLIERHGLPAGMQGREVRCLWVANGGFSGGKPVLGKSELATAKIKALHKRDAIVLLSADHCQEFKDGQIEALLFHQLRKFEENDKETGLRIVAPEFVGFFDELAIYGCWNKDLAMAKAGFEQAKLPSFE